jgi:hypothetical protein
MEMSAIVGEDADALTDHRLYIVKGGVIQTGVNKGKQIERENTTDQIKSYSFSIDDADTDVDIADVTAVNFGIAFAARCVLDAISGGCLYRVDHITCTVNYIIPDEEPEIESDGVIIGIVCDRPGDRIVSDFSYVAG